jgi:hypothetical protein
MPVSVCPTWAPRTLSILALVLLFVSTGCDSNAPEEGLDTDPAIGCEAAGDIKLYVPPKATYLRTSDLDANAGVVGSVPHRLADLGLGPGDTVVLERIGEFQYLSEHPDLVYWGLLVLFSSTNELLPYTERHRVPGAVAITSPAGETHAHVTPPTFIGNHPTDIPEDIVVGMEPNGDPRVSVDDTVEIQIPADAVYLFLSPADDHFSDNLDEDEDFHLCITPVD